MRGNTITMRLTPGSFAYSGPLYQYDYGQKLIFTGVTLPNTYEVHFSNQEHGVSKTKLGDSTGVDIPDEYLICGESVYVWVYLHDGTEDGETEYNGIIQVKRRAKPVDQPPTLIQQRAVDQAIIALNAGIAEAERISGEIPQVVDTALEEAKSSGMFDGFSPSATASKVGDTATITITDKNGTTTATIHDGAKGDRGIQGEQGIQGIPGKDGADGEDGFSPSATVSKTGDTAVISITDKNGTTMVEIHDGNARDIIDDSAGDGDTNNTWSAHKLTHELAEKYEKPVTGIPSSDLANGVIPDISGKYEKPVTGIPASDLAADVISSINAKYEKPAAGIPASDLADGVIPDISGKIDFSEKGAVNGVAELDSSGKVPSSQLPSYVDDTVEYSSRSAFPVTGESSKIYIALDTAKVYRWSGSIYVEISESLALGETSTTAYRGDRGAEAYAAAVANVETVPTEDSSNLITSGAVYTGLAGKADASDTVRDVQIGGNSILRQGVANIPEANTTVFGVVKIGGGYGIYVDSANKNIRISKADDSLIKAGVNDFRPITPSVEHSAAFYGLAKAAGDNTQSVSSNAVGAYTESAKSAINSMLNAPETVNGSTPYIRAKAGVQYICGEVSTLSFIPSATGCCDVIFESGSTPTVLIVPSSVKFPSWFDVTDLSANTVYEINIMNGVYGVVTAW